MNAVESRAMVSGVIKGLTLRQAALTVGFAYLLNPVSYAEFTIYRSS